LEKLSPSWWLLQEIHTEQHHCSPISRSLEKEIVFLLFRNIAGAKRVCAQVQIRLSTGSGHLDRPGVASGGVGLEFFIELTFEHHAMCSCGSL
jgi:hypothetical protein